MSLSTKITPVILCGGSGTRLWPLSRQSFPKQFVPLIGQRNLLQLTLDRLTWCEQPVICVASEEHRFLVQDALRTEKTQGHVLLEPAARNTAAAMALAALLARSNADDDALLLFCPADHHIPDIKAFEATVRRGVPAAEAGAIVTFGVTPSFPSSAYGYILQGEQRNDGSHSVERFIEKPAPADAQKLLLQGNVLWNAGIFLARGSALLAAMSQHAPDILKVCEEAMSEPASEQVGEPDASVRFVRPNGAVFTGCRSQSIDYAVMEPHDNVAVVPFNGQWSDVGSWNAVAELSIADDSGNRITGPGHAMHARNTYIHSTGRTVVALGTTDLLIIETPDAVLVAQKDHAEQVKDVVAYLNQRNCPEALLHRRVARPWGWYDSVDAGERFQVKRIGVKPGASLSLQKHHHRAEHWIVVKGTAEVTRGQERFLLSENQSTYIPIGEVHRLHNPGKMELEMIEVQSGSYLGEDDIVRLEDNYGRNTTEIAK
ncbi:mannose-1-phosphate guanylyltransferase/mannose-6-phosphate isomerase [Hydrogenophaga sp.]|uniref:mannose-1-phosphate guanylyltransferase/mannose-6-phosphate isomerase n=1 Tax=Hydrogenophaga sp. TaxID=1904254 RepID=UPI00271D125A|nr:mannose-1-phosphate guanylyltransferase/mannose-6-phosphate isomerase [Hydrogenophaga sp.]MDO8903397.1 mannose-1-phosphate guanylyltransferase/mannose-6-phosphate isomerase [Hydrogenophaga sp.]